MIYFWLTLLTFLNFCWLGLTFFTLPGNWLMIICVVLFSMWQKGIFSIYTIIAAVILAIIGEVLEFICGAGGAKIGGGSKKSMLSAIGGAIIGALLGTILLPIPLIGTLVGMAAGAGVAVMLTERSSGKSSDKALKAAAGAGIGQLVGTSAKIIIGIVIWLIFTFAAFIK